jgi:hypothetical protein
MVTGPSWSQVRESGVYDGHGHRWSQGIRCESALHAPHVHMERFIIINSDYASTLVWSPTLIKHLWLGNCYVRLLAYVMLLRQFDVMLLRHAPGLMSPE